MTFSADGLADNIQASFHQTGVNDLFPFVLRHKAARRWIIASDFNLGADGAAHNVFAFAAYPIDERDYLEIMQRLKKAIPADFKRTRLISSEIKRFFKGDDCFCFVILAPTARMFFRDHAEHRDNLGDAIDLLDGLQTHISTWQGHEDTKAGIRRLCEESRKKSFSLSLLTNMLTFCVANAVVSYNVASMFGAGLVSWFPDRDNMTTYANSAWTGLAHANFHGMWTSRRGWPSPNVGMIDHRVKGTNNIYDPLIRVPDFLAATISRWDLNKNMLAIPDGTTRDGRRRYRQVIKAWAADNPNVWIGRVFRDEENYIRCARVAVTRTKPKNQRRRAG